MRFLLTLLALTAAFLAIRWTCLEHPGCVLLAFASVPGLIVLDVLRCAGREEPELN